MRTWLRAATYGTALLTILFILPLLLPIWPALRAGIASVSLVLFGVPFVLSAVLLYALRGNWRLRILMSGTMLITLLGVTVPQIAYARIAERTESRLSFNPLSYLHFSGSTTAAPTRTVTYKHYANQDMKLAFYQNAQTGVRPLVVILHGGGWQYGNYLETGNWPRLFMEAGYSVASVEYRLANQNYHTWRDAPRDIHDAIVYLQDHASEFSIDPQAITLFGQSAGGHLALLEAYQNNAVHSVIGLYAPIDLALDYKTSTDKAAEINFLGGKPDEYPARYQQLSPLTYVSNNSPRTLLIQGLSDDLVDRQNARLLATALTDHSVVHETLYLPLSGHSFDNQRGGFTTQLAEQNVLRFLASNR
jgi:acetyl esterase/lipase